MKNLRYAVGFAALISMVGAVSCSTVQQKNSVALSKKDAMRTIASALDAGIVGPNGEVILFYKNGENIVIQQCGDYTVLNSRSDCKTKDGTSVANVPVAEFKSRLKAALMLPVGDYSADMQKKIAVYRKGKTGNTADLLKQQEQVQAAIATIEAFINEYGAANADTAKLAQLRDKLASINSQLGDNAQSEAIIREINGLVDRLVDQIIGQPKLTKFVYSKDKQGFEFNILRAYIRTPGLSATFVRIPHGTFNMGSPESESGRYKDETLHSVTISRDFEMGATDVTQLQWFLVMGYNPSYHKSQQYCKDDYIEINGTAICPNNPVEQVSWDDAQSFIQKLNAGNDGYAYRLPTEAEWEYAARAGSQAAYSFGDDVGRLRDYAWYSDNNDNQSHAVGCRNANAFGLYDMYGNVWQWVQDFYDYYPNSSVTDPSGASSGSERAGRGCGFFLSARHCRSASRSYGVVNARYDTVGFRLVRTK